MTATQPNGVIEPVLTQKFGVPASVKSEFLQERPIR